MNKIYALIEKDHLGDWSPKKDSNQSQDSEDGFRTGCRNVSR